MDPTIKTPESTMSLREHNQQVLHQLAEKTKVLQELAKTMRSMHQYTRIRYVLEVADPYCLALNVSEQIAQSCLYRRRNGTMRKAGRHYTQLHLPSLKTCIRCGKMGCM